MATVKMTVSITDTEQFKALIARCVRLQAFAEYWIGCVDEFYVERAVQHESPPLCRGDLPDDVVGLYPIPIVDCPD